MSLADFEIAGRLGAGSFGTVFKARRRQDGELYVLKTVPLEGMTPRDAEAAAQECHIMAALSSPFVVRYFDSFLDGGSLCIVMELCGGGDLQQHIRENGGAGLPEAAIVPLFTQICLGVAYLHRARVLHRDLKSANIFLASDKRSIKIGDLGVARLLSSQTFFAKTLIGTPYYMSPELLKDQAYDHKSDAWALGIVLYEMATGTHPFDAKNQGALMMKILTGVYPALPRGKYSPQLVALTSALLTLDSRARPSVSDVLQLPLLAECARANGWAGSTSVGAAVVEVAPHDAAGRVAAGRRPDAAALRLADNLLSSSRGSPMGRTVRVAAGFSTMLLGTPGPAPEEVELLEGSRARGRAHWIDVLSQGPDVTAGGAPLRPRLHIAPGSTAGPLAVVADARAGKGTQARPASTPAGSLPGALSVHVPPGNRRVRARSRPATGAARPASGTPSGTPTRSGGRRVLPLSEEAARATAAAASRASRPTQRQPTSTGQPPFSPPRAAAPAHTVVTTPTAESRAHAAEVAALPDFAPPRKSPAVFAPPLEESTSPDKLPGGSGEGLSSDAFEIGEEEVDVSRDGEEEIYAEEDEDSELAAASEWLSLPESSARPSAARKADARVQAMLLEREELAATAAEAYSRCGGRDGFDVEGPDTYLARYKLEYAIARLQEVDEALARAGVGGLDSEP
jgi:hypothetical protein